MISLRVGIAFAGLAGAEAAINGSFTQSRQPGKAINSAQSIKIHALNIFLRTVNISSGCQIFPGKQDVIFMGQSIKYLRSDNVSAHPI